MFGKRRKFAGAFFLEIKSPIPIPPSPYCDRSASLEEALKGPPAVYYLFDRLDQPMNEIIRKLNAEDQRKMHETLKGD